MNRPPPPPPPGPGRARGRAGGVPPPGPPGATGPPRGPRSLAPPAPGGPRPGRPPPPLARPPGPSGALTRPPSAPGHPPSRPPGPPGQRPGPGVMGPGPPPPPSSLSSSSLPSDFQIGAGRVAYRADHRGQVSAPGAQGVDQVSAGVMAMSVSATGATSQSGTAGGGSGADRSSLGRGSTRGGLREPPRDIVRTRPDNLVSKVGETGQPIKLCSNYFALSMSQDWKLNQYHVEFNPNDEDRTYVRRKMILQHKEKLGERFIFDGAMMFTPARHVKPGDTLTLTSQREEDGKIFTLSVRLVKELYYTDGQFVQFLNILHRQCLRGLNLQQLGRNYFDPDNSVTLRDWKLVLWPGYVTSIRQHERGLLLCCEISHKVLRTDTVLDILKSIYREHRENYQNSAVRVLIGSIVITKYNNHSHRIDDVNFEAKPTDTFPRKDGTSISYVDYFRTRYNLTIRDEKQPMVISNPTKADMRRGFDRPVYLVPELCTMTGLTDEMRANFKLMRAVGEYTRTAPDKRVPALMNFSQRMNRTQAVQDELRKWQVGLDTGLQAVPGRLLKPEDILQGGGRKCSYPVDNADWGSELRRFRLYNQVACSKWAVIYPKAEEELTRQFVTSLQNVANGMGFTMSPPKPVSIPDSRTATYVQNLRPAVELKLQMVLIILPNNRTDAYHAIKKELCVNAAVPSQCVTATVLRKFVQKGLASVASKVAIQMATKLGGEPWGIKLPLRDLMVVGYDSFHDSLAPSKDGTKLAVGAVVSSTNASITRFASSVSFHYNNEELLQQMRSCFVKALRHYCQQNSGLYPQRIVVFRDGVGEGDIDYVKNSEIRVMKEVFEEISISPKFTYIVVSKRINTRFFRVNGGAPGNPPSGTIVDDVVTLPERYDFFLISQSVRQGTVNPTNYNVIEDTSGLRPDHIQQLTYKLTHLYYNWPGTVRVPAPCQYAHKLASLVGQSLHRTPNQELETLLYYL